MSVGEPLTGVEAHRAPIAPVGAGVERPLWSVMIPTYNGAERLATALGSVLAQDPGPEVMQIEVVDDRSTAGDPGSVVAELGGGRVGFHRQPENRGHVGNFETCLQRARGRVVHLLHDDDHVRAGFYAKLEAGFAADPDVGAAFCRHIYADADGHWDSLSPLERGDGGVLDGWLPKIAAGQRLATPSIAVRRDVYERLGGFDRRIGVAGEDWEMWVRIAAHCRVWFEPEPLAVYRMKRPGSLTDDAGIAGEMRRATEIVESYLSDHLPEPAAHAATAYARRFYAGWAVERTGALLRAGDLAGAREEAQEALRCSRSAPALRALAATVTRNGYAAAWGALRRRLRDLRETGRRRA